MKYMVRAVLLCIGLIAFGFLAGWHAWVLVLIAWLGFAAAVGVSLHHAAYPRTSGSARPPADQPG